METLRMQVFVIRHDNTDSTKAMAAALSAFRKWAPLSGETEEDAVFANVVYTELGMGGSAQVQLYPELEVAADGEYVFDRKPDAVKTPSPYYLDLLELKVTADRVPKEAAAVVMIGSDVHECLRGFDLNELSQDAQEGASAFDIETLANEGQDGVSGLVMSVLAAAANVPDTDMWNFGTYAGSAEGVTMVVFSD